MANSGCKNFSAKWPCDISTGFLYNSILLFAQMNIEPYYKVNRYFVAMHLLDSCCQEAIEHVYM